MYYNRYTRCRGTAGRDVFPPYHRRVKRALCWCARPPVGTLTRGCISRRFSPDRDRVSEDSPLRAASDQTALQNDRHRVRATLGLCVLRPRPPIFEGGRARVEDSRCPTPLLSFPGRIFNSRRSPVKAQPRAYYHTGFLSRVGRRELPGLRRATLISLQYARLAPLLLWYSRDASIDGSVLHTRRPGPATPPRPHSTIRVAQEERTASEGSGSPPSAANAWSTPR